MRKNRILKLMALFFTLNVLIAFVSSSIYATNEADEGVSVTFNVKGEGDITVYNADGTVDFYDENTSGSKAIYPNGTEITVEATVRDADHKVSTFRIIEGENDPVNKEIFSEYVHEEILTVTDATIIDVSFSSMNEGETETKDELESEKESEETVINEDVFHNLNIHVVGNGTVSFKDHEGNDHVAGDEDNDGKKLSYPSGSKVSLKAESNDEDSRIYGIFFVSEDGEITELEKTGTGYDREWDVSLIRDETVYVIFTGKNDPEPILYNIIGGNPADAVQPRAAGDIGQNWGMYQLFKEYTLVPELGTHVNFGYSHIIQVDVNHDYQYEDVTYTGYCIEYGRECPSGGYLTETALSPNQREYIGYAMAYGWRQTGKVYDPGQYNNTNAQCEYLVTQGIIWCCTENIFNTSTGESAMTKIINGSLNPTYARSYYESLKSTILSLDKKPSFNGSTITLEWNASNNRYEAKVTDSNGMLGYYTYSYSGVTFSKSGNTLTIYTINDYTNGVTAKASRKVYGGANSVVTWNAWNGKQDMATYVETSRDVTSSITIKTKATNGTLTLKKTSANTGITNNNSNYSLAGAVYGVYSNSACTTSVGTLTTVPAGTSNSISLAAGTYYVKEITAPTGYALDSKVYSVTVTANQTSTLSVSDSPITGKIIVKKKASDTTLAANNSDYSNLTATFYIYNSSGTHVATIKTDKNGDGSYSGLALGKYTVKEITAPTGYSLNSSSVSITLSSSSTSKTATFTNSPKLGTINLVKTSRYPDITNNNDCYSLKGAVYVVKNSAGTVVGRITTDASGKGSLTGLPKGTYTIQEEKAPKGYQLDTTVYSKTLGYGDVLTQNVVDNPDTDPFIITVSKVNAVTGNTENEKLAGAEFTIKYYDVEMNTDPALSGYGAVRTWVMKTDSNGEVKMDASHKVSGDDFYTIGGYVSIPIGTVTIEETKAPLGYLVNSTVFVKKISFGTSTEGIINTFNAPVVEEMPHYIKLTLTKTIHANDINFDNGNPMFTFKVTGTDVTGEERTMYRVVNFTEEYVKANTNSNGNVSISVLFDKLIAGTYTASEMETGRYSLEKISGVQNGSINGETVVFSLTSTSVTEGSATFTNDNYEQQNYSDSALVINSLKK